MRSVFADTSYYVALLHRRDDLHERARQLARSLSGVQVITTNAVLVKVLSYYAGHGPEMRGATAQLVRDLLSDPSVEVVSQDTSLFLAGLTLYERRRDKEYSPVDCMSMWVMRERGHH